MADSKQLILHIVATALGEINSSRASDQRIAVEPAARLIGPAGGLDSLEVVTFLSIVEAEIAGQLNVEIALTDLTELTGSEGTMQTVSQFVAFLDARISQS